MPSALLTRNVKQRSVCKHTVERGLGQDHRKKILMKNFAAGFGARHGHEFLRPVQAHGIMSQCTKMAEIPTWSATQVKDGVRRIALNRVEQRCVVLADIVIPCAIPERVGQPIVVGDSNRGKPTQLSAADQR